MSSGRYTLYSWGLPKNNRRRTGTCLIMLSCLLLFFTSSAFADLTDTRQQRDEVYQKVYVGPYNHPELTDTYISPRLEINGVTQTPLAGDLEDLTVALCSGPQAWMMLN